MLKKNLFFYFFIFFYFPNIGDCSPISRKIDLKMAIKLSLINNDKINEKKIGVKKADNLKNKIHGEFNPKLNINMGVGPINRETGNSLSSQSENSWGPIFVGNVKLTYPIWTWGKKNDLLKAAYHAKEIEKENVKIEKLDIVNSIKKFYFGHLLAKTLLIFATDTKKDIETILKNMKEKKAEKEDQYRLEILISEIKTKILEIGKNIYLTKEALSFFISGKKEIISYSPKEDWLEYNKRKLEKTHHYLSIAKKNLPQWKQLSSGLLAKKNLLKAEEKSNLPIIALLAEGNWSETRQRNRQPSSYAFDPFNNQSLSIGVGFTMNLDWGIKSSKIKDLKFDITQLERKHSFAEKGLTLRIIESIENVKALEKKLTYLKKAKRLAKKWLNRTLMAISLGLLNSEKITDAYSARAMTFKNYFETIYENHMAWSKLSQLVGQEIDPFLAQ
jgi:outer membrane protein TolC